MTQSQTWLYLPKETRKKFNEKAEALGISPGELNKRLVLIFLNIDECNYTSNCINCQYYQIATTNAMKFLMKVNEAFSLVVPEYKRVLQQQGKEKGKP